MRSVPTFMTRPEPRLYRRAVFQTLAVFLLLAGIAPSARAQSILTPWLAKDKTLATGEYLLSANKRFFAITQVDGNFCVYAGSNPQAQGNAKVWCSGQTRAYANYFTVMQGDGNLCTYAGMPGASTGGVWCNGSNGAAGNYFLQLRDDGSLAVFAAAAPPATIAPRWSTPAGPPPAPAGPSLIPVGSTIRFRSVNYPMNFMRHQNYRVKMTEVSSWLDVADSTFVVVPGLADPNAVSFRSLQFPNLYLRHRNNEGWVDPIVDQQLFREDATFRVVPGLADAGRVSFQSYAYPTRYLRHMNALIYLHEWADDALYKADATFIWAPASNAPGFKTVINDSNELGENSRVFLQSTAAYCDDAWPPNIEKFVTPITMDYRETGDQLLLTGVTTQRSINDMLWVEMVNNSCGVKSFRLKTSSGKYVDGQIGLAGKPHFTTWQPNAAIFHVVKRPNSSFSSVYTRYSPTLDCKASLLRAANGGGCDRMIHENGADARNAIFGHEAWETSASIDPRSFSIVYVP